MLPTCPEVFIAALTTPACWPPMSRQVLQASPSVNILAAVAKSNQHGRQERMACSGRDQQSDSRHQVSNGTQAGASHAEPPAPRDGVGSHSAQEIAGDAHQEGEPGEQSQRNCRKTMLLFQVGGQPGEAEIKT